MTMSPDKSRVHRRRVVHHAQRRSRIRDGRPRRRDRRDAALGGAGAHPLRRSSTGRSRRLKTDGNQIYGGGYAFGAGAAFEGTFAADPNTGAINWVNDCLGDTYDTFAAQLGPLLRRATRTTAASSAASPTPTRGRAGRRPLPRRSTRPAPPRRRTPTGGTSPDLPYAGLLHWFPDLDFGSYTGQTARRPGRLRLRRLPRPRRASSRPSTASPSRASSASRTVASPARARSPSTAPR